MKEKQFGAVFPESGGLKFVMEFKYVMVIVSDAQTYSKLYTLRGP